MASFYELRERFQGPPVNIESIIRGMGIVLEKKLDLDDESAGSLRRLDDGSYCIQVNAKDHYYRQRFTMAHELAHFMLHRELIEKGIGDNKAYRSVRVGQYENKLIGPTQETEANKLAALILLPEAPIRKLVSEGTTGALELGKIFQISKSAMEIRLKGLELLTPAPHSALYHTAP